MRDNGRSLIRVLATLGPTSLRPHMIRGLEQRNVDMFRINLAHTALDGLGPAISLVREHSAVPICIDTEGAKVRCGVMEPGTVLRAGQVVRLTPDKVVGTKDRISLRPASVFDSIEAGTIVRIDFDGAVLRVGHVDGAGATAMAICGGPVELNRAVSLDPAPMLPALTGKDHRALAVARRLGIEHYALSFAGAGADVELLRDLVPSNCTITARIERRAGVWNRDEIIDAADAVVVDRSNLSREVPLEYVPFYQKAIVREASRSATPVYMATNLVDSMAGARPTTVAEINDLANMLLDGVGGLVLSGETAVGADPWAAVDTVGRLIRAFQRSRLAALPEQDWAFAAAVN